MTAKQIANRTLTHWKVLIVLIGIGITGSIAASGLSHLLKDIQIKQVQLLGDLRYLDAENLAKDLKLSLIIIILIQHSLKWFLKSNHIPGFPPRLLAASGQIPY